MYGDVGRPLGLKVGSKRVGLKAGSERTSEKVAVPVLVLSSDEIVKDGMTVSSIVTVPSLVLPPSPGLYAKLPPLLEEEDPSIGCKMKRGRPSAAGAADGSVVVRVVSGLLVGWFFGLCSHEGSMTTFGVCPSKENSLHTQQFSFGVFPASPCAPYSKHHEG